MRKTRKNEESAVKTTFTAKMPRPEESEKIKNARYTIWIKIEYKPPKTLKSPTILLLTALVFMNILDIDFLRCVFLEDVLKISCFDYKSKISKSQPYATESCSFFMICAKDTKLSHGNLRFRPEGEFSFMKITKDG